MKVLSRLFRGKFLAALREAHHAGKIQGISSESFAILVNKLYRTDWVVYAKRPFGSVERVFQYLGRYTHRVGISNQRLLSVDDRGVRFLTKEGRSVSLPASEFIRRFLQHVLPYSFVKIRHYGLLAPSNVNSKLAIAQRLLSPPPCTATSSSEPAADCSPPETPLPMWQDTLLELTGIDVRPCRACGGTRLETLPLSALPKLDTG